MHFIMRVNSKLFVLFLRKEVSPLCWNGINQSRLPSSNRIWYLCLTIKKTKKLDNELAKLIIICSSTLNSLLPLKSNSF